MAMVKYTAIKFIFFKINIIIMKTDFFLKISLLNKSDKKISMCGIFSHLCLYSSKFLCDFTSVNFYFLHYI